MEVDRGQNKTSFIYLFPQHMVINSWYIFSITLKTLYESLLNYLPVTPLMFFVKRAFRKQNFLRVVSVCFERLRVREGEGRYIILFPPDVAISTHWPTASHRWHASDKITQSGPYLAPGGPPMQCLLGNILKFLIKYKLSLVLAEIGIRQY